MKAYIYYHDDADGKLAAALMSTYLLHPDVVIQDDHIDMVSYFRIPTDRLKIPFNYMTPGSLVVILDMPTDPAQIYDLKEAIINKTFEVWYFGNGNKYQSIIDMLQNVGITHNTYDNYIPIVDSQKSITELVYRYCYRRDAIDRNTKLIDDFYDGDVEKFNLDTNAYLEYNLPDFVTMMTESYVKGDGMTRAFISAMEYEDVNPTTYLQSELKVGREIFNPEDYEVRHKVRAFISHMCYRGRVIAQHSTELLNGNNDYSFKFTLIDETLNKARTFRCLAVNIDTANITFNQFHGICNQLKMIFDKTYDRFDYCVCYYFDGTKYKYRFYSFLNNENPSNKFAPTATELAAVFSNNNVCNYDNTGCCTLKKLVLSKGCTVRIKHNLFHKYRNHIVVKRG